MKWSAKPSKQPLPKPWTGVGPRPELLLHPNVPKPLHTLAPRTVMGSGWWNQERHSAYLAHRNRCWACGIPKDQLPPGGLHAHERYDIDWRAGRARYLGACALCVWCHDYIHDGRMQNMVDSGEMDLERAVAVLDRGEAVLKRAGFTVFKPSYPSPDEMAPWPTWRLVIGTKEYGPAFRSKSEWEAHFRRKNARQKAK